MNVPSSTRDAGLLPLDRTSPTPENTPRPLRRRLTLTPFSRWRLMGNKHDSYADEIFRFEKTKPVLTVSRPRRMRRYGRTVLLWSLLWYAVVQIFPLLLKDRWQYIGTANEAWKWPALRQLVAKKPERPLLLMLGSSRTSWAFRANDLDGMPDSDGRPMNVYNFGIPATGPIHELFYLREMLAEGIRPRFVLIEVLPPLLCEAQRGALTEESMTGFEWISAQRVREWMPYLRRPERRLHTWIQARIAPWYSFRRQLQVELQLLMAGKPLPRHEPVDDRGWHLPLFETLSDADRAHRLEIARGGYLAGLSHFRLGKTPTKALRELLDLCRRENLPAALVVMPESSQFRGWYSEDGKTALHGMLDDLTRTYDVPLIDATCWLADEDFEDGHHTMVHGAEVFTKHLRAQLPRLLAQSEAGTSRFAR